MRWKKFFHLIKPSKQAWKGASFGLALTILIFLALTSYEIIPERHPWKAIIAYFITSLVGFFVIAAIIYAVYWILRFIPRIYLIILTCFLILMAWVVFPLDTPLAKTVIYFPFILFSSLLGGSLYLLFSSSFKSKSFFNRAAILFFLVVGLSGSSSIVIWLIDRGTPFQPPLQINNDNSRVVPIDLQDPGLAGPYEVKSLSYGSGSDRHRLAYSKGASLITNSVNGDSFIQGWTGFEGWLRTWYWGFDSAKLPLNGLVWYPEGKGPFPLVLIVHGNHEMMSYSEEGYAYLGSLFASHGFIAVSIDENFLNDTWLQWYGIDSMPARGWLVLEHLKLWRNWNQDESNPFYQKIDMKKIGLIGHSRGGEAIAIATALNPLKFYPNDGTIKLDYQFDIVSLAAISPVEGQFKPGGFPLRIKNINYFVMHGSLDGDVRSFQGSEQYQRVKFTNSQYFFKAALYIFGANHGQFNSKWGVGDISFPTTALYNLKQIIPEEEQQTIAKVYLTAFLQATLKEKTGYIPLFEDYRTGKSWLPKTEYLNQFEDSTFHLILGHTKDLDLTKPNIKNGHITAKNIDVWQKGNVPLRQRGRFLEAGMYVGWDTCEETKTPSLEITFPVNSVKINENSVLVLSLANAEDPDGIRCDKNDRIDFTIQLKDKNGEISQLPLSHFMYLEPQIKAQLMKVAFLDPYDLSETVYQTFQIPLSDFLKTNSHLNPEEINSINLIFDKSKDGIIVIDKIGFKTNVFDFFPQ